MTFHNNSKTGRRRGVVALLLSFLVAAWAVVPEGAALERPAEELPEAALVLRQGEKVDLNLQFRNGRGETVRLGDYFKPYRPVVLIPAYYHCPRLCGLVFDGTIKLLNELEFSIGEHYQVVTVSFDSREQPELAAQTAQRYRAKFKTPDEAEQGWEFLVGDEPNVAALMSSVGFRYKEDNGEFAHTAALILLTPQGEISQYFTGVAYSPDSVRLALVDASNGAIGSVLDQVFLFCFRYDHIQGRYTVAVYNIVRAVGVLTLLGFGLLWLRLRRRERGAPVGVVPEG